MTALERSLLNNSDMEKAGREGIAMITADEVQTLLLMAKEGAKPEQVRDYVLTLVPKHWP